MKQSATSLWDVCVVAVPDLQQERYERVRTMMDTYAFDALVVVTSAALGQKGRLRYLTNYSPVSRFAGVVFPRQGEPVLFVPYPVHAAWAENVSWIDDVRFSSDFPNDMAAVLRELGCADGRVGIAGDETIAGFREKLTAAIPDAELLSAAQPLAEVRMITGPVELSLARHAASMADRVFTETARLIAAGVTETEVFAAGEARLRNLHAEESLLLIDSIGRQIMPLPRPRTIAVGDLVQYSVEPVSPGGHWIQSIRMFSRGEPSSTSSRVVDTFVEALTAAETTLAPDVPLGDVAGAIAEALGPLAPPTKIPYGHGIGMDNFEPPLLHADSDIVAAVNMILVIHPSLVVEGRHYYVGDTYVVTETGAERLSNYPLELVVV